MKRFSRKFDPFQGSISVHTSSVSSYDIWERRSLYFSDVRFDLFFLNMVHFNCTVRIYFLGSFTHVWASWKLINPLSWGLKEHSLYFLEKWGLISFSWTHLCMMAIYLPGCIPDLSIFSVLVKIHFYYD